MNSPTSSRHRFAATGRLPALLLAFCLACGASIAGVLPEVTITSSDTSADEAGPDVATVTITRTATSATALTVNLSLTGTATLGSDYQLNGVFNGAPLAVSIPANQASVLLTLSPNPDNVVEGEEAAQLTLQPGSGYTVGVPDSQTITIADDVPEVNLTLLDGDMAEAGQDPGSYRVTRTDAGNTQQNIVVNIDITGTATSNSDYQTQGVFTGAPLAVSIPANQLQADFTLTPRLDNFVEGPETIQVTLQPKEAVYTVGASTTADFTITDDVPEMNLTLLDGDMAEAGQDPGSYRVSRTDAGNTQQGIVVNIDITGTATSNSDYQTQGVFGGAPLAVSIPANQLQAEFTFTPQVDNLIEGPETIQVTLQPNAAVYTVGANTSANFTIADDVPVVNISVVDGDMGEQDLNPGVYRVARSSNGNMAQSLVVNIDVAGTAMRNVDYQTQGVFGGSPLAVQIPANLLEADFMLTPLADAPDDEGDETVEITLQAGTNYMLGAATEITITLADLIDFLFSDSFENIGMSARKSCNVGRLAARNPGRFFDQGPSVLDLESDLVWARCALDASYDWSSGRCVSLAEPGGSPMTDRFDRFNAGLLGDNAGFQDWRPPTASEQATLPDGCWGSAVR